jgi:hypothetical protein
MVLAAVAIVLTITVGAEIFDVLQQPVRNFRYLIDRSGDYSPHPALIDSAGQLIGNQIELVSGTASGEQRRILHPSVRSRVNTHARLVPGQPASHHGSRPRQI